VGAVSPLPPCASAFFVRVTCYGPRGGCLRDRRRAACPWGAQPGEKAAPEELAGAPRHRRNRHQAGKVDTAPVDLGERLRAASRLSDLTTCSRTPSSGSISSRISASSDIACLTSSTMMGRTASRTVASSPTRSPRARSTTAHGKPGDGHVFRSVSQPRPRASNPACGMPDPTGHAGPWCGPVRVGVTQHGPRARTTFLT